MGNINIGSNHGQINIYRNVYGRRHRRKHHPILTGFAVLLLIGLLVKFWWVVLIGGAIWLGAKGFKKHQAVAELQRRSDAAIAARTEAQNSAYLNGDPYGVFGNG